MVLYLGSQKGLPVIDFNPDLPAFHSRVLEDDEKSVVQHFSLPFVIYIGTHEGCGCSFRSAHFVGQEWFEVDSYDDEEALLSQKNHQSLSDYLKRSELAEFEIFACWDGDYNEVCEYRATINVDDLLNPDFFFKERGHYRITV